MANTPPSQTIEPTNDEDALPISAAFPYPLHSPATSSSSILLRRLAALGTTAALLYLIHPLPHLSSLTSSPLPKSIYEQQTQLPLFLTHLGLQALDTLLSTILILGILVSGWKLALYEGEFSMNGKTIELKWLMPLASGIVALVATADETWIKINLLWDLVFVLGVCGWNVMSTWERKRAGLWVLGAGLGRMAWEVWGEVGPLVECLFGGLGPDCDISW